MFTDYTHSHFPPCIPQSTTSNGRQFPAPTVASRRVADSCELSRWSTAMFNCCLTGQLSLASIGRLCMRPVLLAAVRSSNPSPLLGAQHVVRRSLQNDLPPPWWEECRANMTGSGKCHRHKALTFTHLSDLVQKGGHRGGRMRKKSDKSLLVSAHPSRSFTPSCTSSNTPLSIFSQ
ncbi:hypothetical protein BDP81DRAFT_39940 [Colletotrichum phormii]|uniref:Uncharacterized protein n=1 Tax=Colletotrichum phormii TaxID=359342 RepID=A0AAJ0ED82_9PEZI|nr:uncharacterized protein BDP81DRAFT_39940 [Colletotrichum phormii]KAK1635602.1 hypothetical protein BDP81DRAFT_39940 [Colletotrichum phormii]